MTRRFSCMFVSSILVSTGLLFIGCVSSDSSVEPIAPSDGASGSELVSDFGATAGYTNAEGDAPAKRNVVSSSGSTGYYLSKKTIENMQERIGASREVLKQKPYDLESFKVFAYDALARANPEGTLVFLQSATERGITLDDEGNILAGVAYLMRGDQGKGFEALNRANSLNPANVLPDINMGVYYLSHGNATDARISFSRVLSREPGNVVAHLHAGIANFLLRDFKAAESHLKDALSGPDRAVAHYNLGLVYQIGMRERSAARRQFQAVVNDEKADSTLRDQAQGAILVLDREEDSLQGMTVSPEQK